MVILFLILGLIWLSFCLIRLPFKPLIPDNKPRRKVPLTP